LRVISAPSTSNDLLTKSKPVKEIAILHGLTGHGIDRTIYRIRGEHTNHHTTDAVLYFIS
jgi:hypothetical protein